LVGSASTVRRRICQSFEGNSEF